jgi:hypothetical protein
MKHVSLNFAVAIALVFVPMGCSQVIPYPKPPDPVVVFDTTALYAGAARLDITPEPGHVVGQQFQPACGCWDRIYVRAIYLASDQGKPGLALVSIDLPYAPLALRDAAAKQLKELLPGTSVQLIIAATGNCNGARCLGASSAALAQPGRDCFDQIYFDLLGNQIAAAVKKAHDSASASTIEAGSALFTRLPGRQGDVIALQNTSLSRFISEPSAEAVFDESIHIYPVNTSRTSRVSFAQRAVDPQIKVVCFRNVGSRHLIAVAAFAPFINDGPELGLPVAGPSWLGLAANQLESTQQPVIFAPFVSAGSDVELNIQTSQSGHAASAIADKICESITSAVSMATTVQGDFRLYGADFKTGASSGPVAVCHFGNLPLIAIPAGVTVSLGHTLSDQFTSGHLRPILMTHFAGDLGNYQADSAATRSLEDLVGILARPHVCQVGTGRVAGTDLFDEGSLVNPSIPRTSSEREDTAALRWFTGGDTALQCFVVRSKDPAPGDVDPEVPLLPRIEIQQLDYRNLNGDDWISLPPDPSRLMSLLMDRSGPDWHWRIYWKPGLNTEKSPLQIYRFVFEMNHQRIHSTVFDLTHGDDHTVIVHESSDGPDPSIVPIKEKP